MAKEKTSTKAGGPRPLTKEQQGIARALKALLELQPSDLGRLPDALAELLAKPGAVEAANAKGFLAGLLELYVPCEYQPQGQERVPALFEAKVRAVRMALEAGCDPNVPGGPNGGTPLYALCSDALGTVTYDTLLDELLSRGAAPDLVFNGCYPLVALANAHHDPGCRTRMLDRLLALGPSQAHLRAALTRLVDGTGFSYQAIDDERFRILVRGLEDKQSPEPRIVPMHFFAGATLLHRAVVARNLRAVEILLDEGADPAFPMPRKSWIYPSLTTIRGVTAGKAVKFNVRAGANALDLARGCAAAAAGVRAKYASRVGDDYGPYTEKLGQIADLLAARGVKPALEGPAVQVSLSDSEPVLAEPFKAGIDALLVDLAGRAGTAPAAVAPRLAPLEPQTGPWEYFEEAVAALRAFVPFARLDASSSRLAWLFDPQGGTAFDDGVDYDNLGVYPQAARKDLLRGTPIRVSGADVIFLLPRKDGHCHVLHAHPEGYWLLGDTVPAFLAAELPKIVARG